MRSKLSLFLAAVLTATLLGLGGGGAVAASTADLSTTVTGQPATVSPVGGIVLYTATFENLGALPVPAVFSDATDAGTFVAGLSDIPDFCTAPDDEAPNPVISCDTVLSPGVPVVIEVAVRTPSLTGVVSNTSTIAVHPEVVDEFVDDNSANDSATVTTSVLNDPNNSAALVKEGESLTFGPHIVTVTNAPNGIVILLAGAPGGGDLCGPSLCGDGLHLDFGKDEDRQGTMHVELNFSTDPCRGLGAEKCTAVYERKHSGTADETITAVPPCSTTTDPTTTCVIEVTKVGSNFRHLLRMYSEDPDLLPPLSV